jgi:CheY-like chemotaxis protein
LPKFWGSKMTKKKVLIVDDEVDVANILQAMVVKLDYVAVLAHNAKEALQKMALENFDLILTDLHMPGMSGVDLAQQVRDSLGFVGKIVALTGDCLTPDYQGGVLFEYIDGRLSKPFTTEQIKHLLLSMEEHNKTAIQRAFPRTRAHVSASLITPEREIKGHLLSLGRGGAFFHTMNFEQLPPEGAEVMIHLTEQYPNIPENIIGRCQWQRPTAEGPWPAGIGIKFKNTLSAACFSEHTETALPKKTA